MREDDIGGGFHIDQSPAEFVVGAWVSEVIRRVDEESLEQAGAGALAECVRVELLDQGRRAGGIRRRHAGAAVGAIVGGIACGSGGVDTHAVGNEVGLDAPVVAGSPARETTHGSGRCRAHACNYGVVHRADGDDIFSEGIECDRLEASLCGEGSLFVACRPERKVIGQGPHKSVGRLSLSFVAAHVGRRGAVSVGVVRERHGRERGGCRCAAGCHLGIVIIPIVGIDGGLRCHALRVGIDSCGSNGPSDMCRMIVEWSRGVFIRDPTGQLSVRVTDRARIPHADLHSGAIEAVGSRLDQASRC